MIYIVVIILCVTNLWLLHLVEQLNDVVILTQEAIKELQESDSNGECAK